jgi:hypothetical protein
MPTAFTRKYSKDIGTTPTAIGSYTVGADTETILLNLSVSNTIAADVVVSVILDAGTDDVYLVEGATVVPGGALVVDHKPVLITGDSIKVVSDTAASVDVIMSIMERT